MNRSVVIELVAFGVLVPITLVSIPLTIPPLYILPNALNGALYGGNPAPVLYVAAIAILGWLGIICMWRLYFALKAKTEHRLNPKLVWSGLGFGSLASVILSIHSFQSIFFALMFAWPLIGAIAYGIMYKHSRLQCPEF